MNDESIDRAHPAVQAQCCCADPLRRTAVKAMAGVALVAAGVRPVYAEDGGGPRVGDLLVLDDDAKKPLRSEDVKLEAKQLIVLPFDPQTGKVRDDRLNRIIVIRLDPKEMSPETAKVAADGVVAYSSICVHQNCEVNGWLPKEKEFLCVCHFSKFSPLRYGEVTGGPAPRPLPSIPLKIVDGNLAIAGEFSARPGGQV